MTIKPNVGGWDRWLRIGLGIVIIGAGWYFKSWWGLVGVVLLVTGLVRYCALYTLLGIKTCECDKE